MRSNEPPKSKWRSKPCVLLAVLVLLLVASGLLVWFLLLSPRRNQDKAINTAQQQPEQQQPPEQQQDTTVSPTVSRFPSSAPSTVSSSSPSSWPSQVPSNVPSLKPTIYNEYVPPNPIPDNPPNSYFNYDIADTRYGPNAWDRIDMTSTYWEEFGDNGFGTWNQHLSESIPNPTKNRCGQPGRQSPVHLRSPIAIECTASHQIRYRVSLIVVVNDVPSLTILSRAVACHCPVI